MLVIFLAGTWGSPSQKYDLHEQADVILGNVDGMVCLELKVTDQAGVSEEMTLRPQLENPDIENQTRVCRQWVEAIQKASRPQQQDLSSMTQDELF